jgi:putative transcriptional regulator
MSRFQLQQGKVLIAEPFMQDSYFKKSVVALCDYSKKEGSVGFILNRPTNLKMEEVMQDFPEFDSIIYYGGPVANDTIHYIHRLGDLVEGSKEIMPGLFWGGDFKKLKFLINTGVIKPYDIRFYIGYSGWSAGQLEDEMDINSWVIDDMDINYPFMDNHLEMWNVCLHNKGNNYSVMADMVDSISMN